MSDHCRVLRLSYIAETALLKAFSKTSLMFSPVLADTWKYSYPFFFAYAMASAGSTSFVRPSHLLPTSMMTESFAFTPQFFMTASHLLKLLKLSRFYKSKTSRITWASAQKGLRISQQSALPLRSKKLTAILRLETVTFLTPQSTPIVVMYFCTNLPQQQRLIMHDLPTFVSPTEINWIGEEVPSAGSGFPTCSNCGKQQTIIQTLAILWQSHNHLPFP